jgi:hypothetical protein
VLLRAVDLRAVDLRAAVLRRPVVFFAAKITHLHSPLTNETFVVSLPLSTTRLCVSSRPTHARTRVTNAHSW